MTTPSPNPSPLTSLPRLEDLPQTDDGTYEPDGVREAFDSFRRHALQLQAQLRVLQAAGKTASVDPTGHAVRMDALHLIRAAAEFADTLERVGELGCGANEMEGVHAHRVTGRVDARGLARGLQHAQLRLQLERVAAERVERLADPFGLEAAVLALRQVLQAREGGERRLLR